MTLCRWLRTKWNSCTDVSWTFLKTLENLVQWLQTRWDGRFNLLSIEKPFIYRIFRPSRFLTLKALNISAVTVRNWWVDIYLLDHDLIVCQQETGKLWHRSKQTVRGQRQHIWFQIALPSAVVNRGCKLFTEASASWATVAATCLCHGSPVGEDQNTLRSNTRSSYQSHISALGEIKKKGKNQIIMCLYHQDCMDQYRITLNKRLSIFKPLFLCTESPFFFCSPSDLLFEY